MSDVDTKVRDALQDLAGRAPIDPVIPPQLRRRVRRRRAATVALAGALAAAIVAGGVFGVAAAIRVRGNSLQRPAAYQTEPWPGLYPAATAQEGEQLQACVDAGSHGACARYVNVEDVVRGYAIQHLGWPGVYFPGSFVAAEEDASGPLTVTIGQCSPVEGEYFPKGCVIADVTVERLLRHDATGVWFVIDANESVSDPDGSVQQAPTEAQVKAFVEKFMTLRMEGAREALGFLSETAKSQFDRGENGLVLFGEGVAGNGYLFDHFTIESVEAADANSFEVRVSVVMGKDPGDQNAEERIEMLAVGPGHQDHRGDLQPLVIRGAVLVSSSPLPAP
jgi:hypothetical protein